MPLFLAALLGGLVDIAGTLVGRVLVSLGIGYAVFSGVDTSLAFAKTYAVNSLQGLPAQALAVAGAMKIGVAISILVSALSARLVLNGMTGGALKRMVQR